MAAGAAPEIPVLAYMAVGLLLLLAWMVLRGLAAAYKHTLGWLLDQLAIVLDFRVWRFHVDLGGPVDAVSKALLHVLTAGADKAEHGAGYFFHGAAVLQEWATRELLHLASETFAQFSWLQDVHIPRWVKWAVTIAVPPLLIAKLIRAAIRAELPKVLRYAHAAGHAATTVITQRIALPHLAEWQWLHRHWKALTAAIAATAAGAIAGPFPWVHVFPRLRQLELGDTSIRKRLRRLEKLLAAGGLAVALANVLGLPNWRCLTRGNIGRTARALCGVPTNLLNDLLGLIVDYVLLTDICEVVGWLETGLKVIEPELTALIVAADMALCDGDYQPPPTFDLIPFTATPQQQAFGIG